MTRIKRPAATIGAAALLAFSLTACGGAPTDASKDEFCEAIDKAGQAAFEDIDLENPDEEAFVDALKESAEDLEEVGTPEDISDDAREGWELTIEAVKDLDADDIDFEDPELISDEFSEDEQKKVDAYDEYENETCGGGEEEVPVE